MNDLLHHALRTKTVFAVILLLISPHGLAASSNLAIAKTIEVFTTVEFPSIPNHGKPESFENSTDYQVYPIDAIERFQQALSEGLPGDRVQAKQRVLTRFQTMDSDINASLEQAATGLAKALQYGIDRYPAMVFDGALVVYGVTDIDTALDHYQQWREETGR